MTTHDAILAALAPGPRTARELAAAVGLEDFRDVLDPIAQLSRARLVTLAPPNPRPRRDGPGTTIRYRLTKAGADAARHADEAPRFEPVPADPTETPREHAARNRARREQLHEERATVECGPGTESARRDLGTLF